MGTKRFTILHSNDMHGDFLGSGSIRVEELGAAVTLGEFMSCFPYDDTLTRYAITGKALSRAFAHVMRSCRWRWAASPWAQSARRRGSRSWSRPRPSRSSRSASARATTWSRSSRDVWSIASGA